MRPTRRQVLIGGLFLATSTVGGRQAAAAKPTITVHKSPT